MIRLKLAPMVAGASALLVAETSFAYVDPGTGSLIIQWVFGMVVAGFAMMNIYWHRFKQFISGRSATRQTEADKKPAEESGSD